MKYPQKHNMSSFITCITSVTEGERDATDIECLLGTKSICMYFSVMVPTPTTALDIDTIILP